MWGVGDMTESLARIRKMRYCERWKTREAMPLLFSLSLETLLKAPYPFHTARRTVLMRKATTTLTIVEQKLEATQP